MLVSYKFPCKPGDILECTGGPIFGAKEIEVLELKLEVTGPTGALGTRITTRPFILIKALKVDPNYGGDIRMLKGAKLWVRADEIGDNYSIRKEEG